MDSWIRKFEEEQRARRIAERTPEEQAQLDAWGDRMQAKLIEAYRQEGLLLPGEE